MRKQYYIMQYQFKNITEVEDKLIVDPNKGNYFNISENIYFKELFTLTGTEFVKGKPINNFLKDIFILKSSNIEGIEKEANYERVIRGGIYIKGLEGVKSHFVISDQSSSMIRTQKAIFIREAVKEGITEQITLGKTPKKAVPAKVITGKGLMLSSVDIINLKPRICVIPDFERKIPGKVYQIENYKLKPEDEVAKKIYDDESAAENIKFKRYLELKKEATEILTQLELKKLPLDKDKKYKSKNQWDKENRRVKPEELIKPIAYNTYNFKNYPVYDILQTKEIKYFSLEPYSVGFEKIFHDFKLSDKECPVINCFDGEGIASFEFMKKVKKELKVKFDINSFQMRLPYIKSNVIRFDTKEWFESNGITSIPDIFNETVQVKDVDIFLTKSCFKAYLEKTEKAPNDGCLFDSIKEYKALIDSHNYDYFGIANYSHPYDKNEFCSLTYQFINSTELGRADLYKLSYYIIPLINKVKKGDIIATKTFLNIINKVENDNVEDESDMEETKDEFQRDKSKVIIEALELNELLIHDKYIQGYIKQQIKTVYENMQLGKILVPSSFLFATGDVIAFMEWVAYRKEELVKGFLKADEFYCNSIEKDKIIARYPLTHHSEVTVAKFIKNDNEYVKHLNNIIQFNTFDLMMCRLNEDFDGDKNFLVDADMKLKEEGGEYSFYKLCEHEYLRECIVDDYPIYNPGDKVTAPASEFNMDAIVKFELMNLSSQTGKVTNLNTSYQTMSRSEGHLINRDLESSVCKMLQGAIIDSVKLQTEVIIPKILNENGRKKANFLKCKYGGDKNNYMIPISPLDLFSGAITKKLKSLFFSDNNEDEEFVFEINPMQTMSILIDEKVCSSDTLMKVMSKIRPIFISYSTERGKIYEAGRETNRLSSKEEDKDEVKAIQARYHELYQNTREECLLVMEELNIDLMLRESILATAATKIEYVMAKNKSQNGIKRNSSYIFPWVIAPIGLLQNIKAHEDTNKTQLIELKEIYGENIDRIIEVSDGFAYIKGEKISMPKMKNGNYLMTSSMGRQFVTKNIELEKELNLPSITEYEGLEENESPVVAIKDLETSLIRINVTQIPTNLNDEELEAAQIKLKEEVKALSLRIDNQILYLNNYSDRGEPCFALFDKLGEYIGKIRRDEYEIIDKNIALRNYVGKSFKVNVIPTTWAKSFKIILNSI